jgi:hypothetical protein
MMKLSIARIAAVMTLACTAAGSAAHKTPASLLPAGGEIEGWRVDGGELSYGPENLWEYINGQAESFLMYDFRSVAARRYMKGEDLEIKAEIYDHGSPLMAFGIYSQFRSPGGTYLDIGNEAFGDDYSLHFWKGRFYVKISAYDDGEESGEAMKRFARTIAGKIEEGGVEPPETALFPGKGLEKKSVTYVTVGALGSGKLPPAFTGEYTAGGEKGKLYIFPLSTEAASKETFEMYVAETGASSGAAGAGKIEYLLASGEAPYRGHMRIFSFGRFMGVLTGFAEGSQEAREIVDEAVMLMAAHHPRESG